MSDSEINTNVENNLEETLAFEESQTIEFALEEMDAPSSSEFIAVSDDAPLVGAGNIEVVESALSSESVIADELADKTPAFRELALPKLPELKRENRAWLQIQSPNRLFFYWSIKNNPFQNLNKAIGKGAANYTFVLKLIDVDLEAEELHPIEAEGSWWFSVAAGRDYKAEIGFYAPNRPFVRVLYSDTVQTPRKSPSPRSASDAEWRIPAQKFAEVLDVSGFKQDAFDVALAGDNVVEADNASQRAFSKMTGDHSLDLAGIDAEELRYAMLALASGATLEQLRHRISERLFLLLDGVIDNIGREQALAALRSEFDINDDELVAEEEEFGPAVFGASLVNFPKNTRLRTKPRGFDRLSKFESASSHSVLN